MNPRCSPSSKTGQETPPEVMGVEIKGDELNIYTLNDSPDETSYFRGRITEKEIVGRIKGQAVVERLPRVPNHMRLYQDCK